MSRPEKRVWWVAGAVVALGVAGVSHGQSAGKVINESRRIIADDAAPRAGFGGSIARDDGLVVVGSPEFDDRGVRASGAVYVFDELTGEQLYQLVLETPERFARFGTSVAVADGIIAVGQPAVIRLYDAETGMELRELRQPDADQPWLWGGFGEAIAMGDGYLAAGVVNWSPLPPKDFNPDFGLAYVFDVHTGEVAHRLFPDGLESGFRFGEAVAIDEGLLVISAPGTRINVSDSVGAVYAYDLASGELLSRALGGNGESAIDNRGSFGKSLSLAGGLLVVGAPRANVDGVDRAGAAYMFSTDPLTPIRMLIAPELALRAEFGWSVGVDSAGEYVGVGAWLEDRAGEDSGAAYVFDVETGDFAAELAPSDIDRDHFFGFTLEVWEGTAAAYAFYEVDGDNAGSVVFFQLAPGDGCPTDWDGNGVVNPADVGAYLSDYFRDLANGTLVADFDGNGVTNPADVGAFLSAYYPAIGACP